MLRDDEIVDILKLVDFRISKSEIGAFCRSENHPKYRSCGDQVLRNFLNGLVIYLRGSKENPKVPGEVLMSAFKAKKSITSQDRAQREKPTTEITQVISTKKILKFR